MNEVIDEPKNTEPLKSAFPDIQAQLDDASDAHETTRAYYLCTILGSAKTKRDLQSMLKDRPLIAGENIIIGRPIKVTKRFIIEYDLE